MTKPKGRQNVVPKLASKDAGSQEVLNCLILLITQTMLVQLSAVQHLSLMANQRNILHLGDAQDFHNLFQGSNVMEIFNLDLFSILMINDLKILKTSLLLLR